MIIKQYLAAVINRVQRAVVEVGRPVTKLLLNPNKTCDRLGKVLGNIC